MGVTPAGSTAPNSGHHHLLIDVDDPIEPNEPIPQDKKHLHFGAGQTEARIELPPGKHTLQLVLGDAKHYPFNPPIISKKITVTEMNVATVRPATTVVRNGSRAGCLGSPRLLKSASIAIRVARVEAIGLARNLAQHRVRK